MSNPSLGGSNLGGGAYNGISPKQTITNYKSSQEVLTRRILRSSWNGDGAAGVINDYDRVITPFRAVMNLGDFLGRQNYVCGGANQNAPLNAPRARGNMGTIMSVCDDTGVPAGSGNSKFVSDSSDYARYKRERAQNQNYNDPGFGGYNNSAYVHLMHVRRHH
jgi:hypothetical protein